MEQSKILILGSAKSEVISNVGFARFMFRDKNVLGTNRLTDISLPLNSFILLRFHLMVTVVRSYRWH